MPKIRTPKAFMARLQSLAKRQARVRDDLRELQYEAAEFLEHNTEASEALDTAIEALSRLA